MAATCIPSLLTGYPHRPGSMHVYCVCLYLIRLGRLDSRAYYRLYQCISTNSSPQTSTKHSCSAATALAHRCILEASSFVIVSFQSFFLFASPQALSAQATPLARDISSDRPSTHKPFPIPTRNSHIIALPLAKSPGLHDQSWPHRLVPIFFESWLLMQSDKRSAKLAKEQTLERERERGKMIRGGKKTLEMPAYTEIQPPPTLHQHLFTSHIRG